MDRGSRAILIAEVTLMDRVTLTAEIVRRERVTANVHPRHEVALWRSAARELGERAYGDVHVRADWAPLQGDDGIVQMAIDLMRWQMERRASPVDPRTGEVARRATASRDGCLDGRLAC